MPIYATTDAKEFWTGLPAPSRARSLAAARFVSIAADNNDKEWRKQSCDAIATGATLAAKLEAQSRFTAALVEQGGALIHGKLEARLILDAAGGVLENGGICLDRTSGIPFIPGSAVKGCARRYAIHLLSEEDDPDKKAELLARIAILFGYGDQEWKPGRMEAKDDKHHFVRSDFWLAMVPLFEAGIQQDPRRDELWEIVAPKAAQLIFAHLSRTPNDLEKPLPPQLPNLAGTIRFLPAYPVRDPAIKTDVLTPHHGKYYSAERDIATDDEDPFPVLFPTVSPGASFVFPLLPSSCTPPEYLELAESWLAESLNLFGLGAKTNAGYGWFRMDASAKEEFEQRIQELRDAAEVSDLKPCPEIEATLRDCLAKKQLAGAFNKYAFDQKLWPKDTTMLYLLTLYHFIQKEAPELMESKKGKKAMGQIAAKLNLPTP